MNRIKTEKRENKNIRNYETREKARKMHEKTSDGSESIHHRPYVVITNTPNPDITRAKPIPDASWFSIYSPLMLLKINRFCNIPTVFPEYFRLSFCSNFAFHPAYPVYPCLASFAAIRRRSPTAIDMDGQDEQDKNQRTRENENPCQLLHPRDDRWLIYHGEHRIVNILPLFFGGPGCRLFAIHESKRKLTTALSDH